MTQRIEPREVEQAVRAVREAARAAEGTASQVGAAQREAAQAAAGPPEQAAQNQARVQQRISQAQAAHSTAMNRLQQAQSAAQQLLQRCQQELEKVRAEAERYRQDIQKIRGREAAQAASAVKFDKDIDQLSEWVRRLGGVLQETRDVGRISGGSLETRVAGAGALAGGSNYGVVGGRYGGMETGYGGGGTGYAAFFGAGGYRSAYAPTLDRQLAPYRGPRAVQYVRETTTVVYRRVRETLRYIW